MRFDQEFITSVVPEAQCLGTGVQDLSGVSIDSRDLSKGDIFVAIQGQQDDGHKYINEALTKGAVGLIINADKKSILDAIKPAAK